jgi:TldD protein
MTNEGSTAKQVNPREMTRREFLNKITTGTAAVGFIRAHPGWAAAGVENPGQLSVPSEVLQKAVKILMSKGADFADVFVERATADTYRSDDKKIDTQSRVDKGVGLRAVKKGRTFYAFSESLKEKDILETAGIAADASAADQLKHDIDVITLQPQVSPLKFPITPLPSDISIKKKIEMIQGLTDLAFSFDSRTIQAIQIYTETYRHITLATSSGKLIDQVLGLTEFITQTVLKDKNGDVQAGIDGKAAYAGQSFFIGENSFSNIVKTSIKRAQYSLSGVDCPRGVFPVVLAPGMGAVIFHEACGHGMEADLANKGSNFNGKLGKPVAAKEITLVDDGTLPFMPGSFAFDDEGTPSQRTVMIKDGILVNYLCDLVWGKKMGLESTGSGRRESFRFPPIPRMRNTFIENGTLSHDDIIANTKRGVYIVMTAGGQVDVISGKFMMGAAEAHLIENGKITSPVKKATISGTGIEALRSIDMVGNNLTQFPCLGRCGKGQRVPVGVGMPTARVRSILVGGSGPSWDEKQGGAS